jgi:hypothetical protein
VPERVVEASDSQRQISQIQRIRAMADNRARAVAIARPRQWQQQLVNLRRDLDVVEKDGSGPNLADGARPQGAERQSRRQPSEFFECGYGSVWIRSATTLAVDIS